MVFTKNVAQKLGLRLKKRTGSPDDDFGHVTSELTAWKASSNR